MLQETPAAPRRLEAITRSAAETMQRYQRTLLTVAIWVIVVLALIVLLVPVRGYVRRPQAQGWQALGSLFDGTINTLLVEDPSGVRVMYAGTEGGVFKSLDQGKTWTACNTGLTDLLVRSLAMDPNDPNILYAGTWSGKVFMTNSAGAHWQQRSGYLPPYEIRDLAVHGRDPQRLYALNPWSVFVTSDRGQHWYQTGEVTNEPVNPNEIGITGTLQCMMMNPEQPGILYVGTTRAVKRAGLYMSTNGGNTWNPSATRFSDVSAIVPLPRAPGTLYAIASGKVYTTGNAGLSWNYADAYRDDATALSIAVNPKNPAEVYVGFKSGIYKSTDGRQTWSRSDKGLEREDGQPVEPRVLVVDPLDPNMVYACTGNQLFVSEDKGATWEFRSAIWANGQATILAVAADPKDGNTFYASADGGGLYKTDNGGSTWQHVGEPLPAEHITAVAVDPIDTRIVYVGYTVAGQGRISKSTDGGASWPLTLMVPITNASISALAIDPEESNRLYAGTEGRGIFRTDDGGRTWVHKADGIGHNIRRILVNVKESPTAVYALDESTVSRSYNQGETWRPWDPGFLWADIAPPVKSSIQPFLVTGIPAISMTALTAVEAQTGDGVTTTWSTITVLSQPEGAEQADLTDLTVGAAMPDALYALVQGQGVLRKTQADARWTALGMGLASPKMQALALSPDDPDLILVGTNRGIYRYQPDRSPWQDIQAEWQGLRDKARRFLERQGKRIRQLIG